MKKMFCILAMGLLLSGTARADVVQLDDVFTKTNTWLKKENLNLTGSSGARDDVSAFSQETVMFFGEAVSNPAHSTPAQREMMAKRAAEVVAKRAVVEYLEGFALVGDTLVRDSMAQYDVIRSATSGFVKGVQVVATEYSRDADRAVAIVKIGLHGPGGYASTLYEKILADPKVKKELLGDKPSFKAKPVPMVESYDGLIIDASGQNFRPALINRIFTEKGEVLYDPAKIEKKMLIEQGCGEYSNSVEKARDALSRRGVKNPLVIPAAGAVSSADLSVSADDSVRIFSADQKAKFFADARVAFVLK